MTGETQSAPPPALDPATQDACAFYEQHYVMAEPIMLTPGVRIRLGDPARPRRCRFCRLSEPEVSFKDEAHAFPAAFGNTGLTSYYECDDCNHHFGEGIENHLGNWTKPLRTLSRIRGRSGVPTIKKPGPEKGWRVEYEESGFKLTEYENEPFFELDEEAKMLRFSLHRDTYIPVAVLKGLVKIGLTLLPEREVDHFQETFDWIRDNDHRRNFVSDFPILRTFVPGPVRSDLIVLMQGQRRPRIESVPYAFFMLAYGNEILQVFLPSIAQDACIAGKPLEISPFPNPGTADPALYGRPKTVVEHLTGREPVPGEKVPAMFRFEAVSGGPVGGEADA